MATVRINKEHYEALKKRADKERRPLGWVITDVLNEVLAPRKNPQLKEKKAHPFFQPLKDIYIQAWEKNNGFEYRWNGAVDASALNRLIKTLESLNEKEGSIVDFFKVIMERIPEFYKDKTINAINKNINGIIADIKNPRGGQAGHNPSQYGIYDYTK